MKRSDIKEGMILICEDKSKHIVVRSSGGLHAINASTKCGLLLREFCSEDLSSGIFNPSIIMEIKDGLHGGLIYKRKIIELTMREIADRLNIDVAQLRIKNA